MTSTIETAQSRRSWREAFPLPDAEQDEPFSLKAMRGHWAAMYRAHIEAYHAAVRVWSDSEKGVPEPATAEERFAKGAPLRTALIEHLHPAQAAWTAAALLSGMTVADVAECYDSPQGMDECAWEWLMEASGRDSHRFENLTTDYVQGEDGVWR